MQNRYLYQNVQNIKFRRKILEEIDSTDFNDMLILKMPLDYKKVYFYHAL